MRNRAYPSHEQPGLSESWAPSLSESCADGPGGMVSVPVSEARCDRLCDKSKAASSKRGVPWGRRGIPRLLWAVDWLAVDVTVSDGGAVHHWQRLAIAAWVLRNIVLRDGIVGGRIAAIGVLRLLFEVNHIGGWQLHLLCGCSLGGSDHLGVDGKHLVIRGRSGPLVGR